ncbi:MAG: ATP synthase F0F1 subunit epsilon [Gracilibacter sp. BRH_c7a]|nr:MAG: ATP synthase F0F1 subunit epsilon [Gracilibacter sp. BRH_c7a]
MTTFNLNVVSPDGQVIDKEVEFVVLPSVDGELGILANHAPLIAGLEAGVMRYTEDGKVYKIAICGGFVEVAKNKVSVLANTAEKAEKINVERALAAKERAQKRLQDKSPDVDVLRAEMALKRAVARLKTTGKL